MRHANVLLATVMIGMGTALGSHEPATRRGYGNGRGFNPDAYSHRTLPGGRVQNFRHKKARNLKGRSR